MRKSKGVELIMDLKRANGTLMPYDASTMSGIAEDIQVASGELDSISANNTGSSLDSMETVCKAIIHHEKFCAVTYLMERMDMIREARWELGPALPNDLKSRMSNEEQEFFSGYSRLVGNYQDKLGLDLGSDICFPPKELFMEVRGVSKESEGDGPQEQEVYTEDGSISLNPDTVQYVRRNSTVESLIRQGILEDVT